MHACLNIMFRTVGAKSKVQRKYRVFRSMQAHTAQDFSTGYPAGRRPQLVCSVYYRALRISFRMHTPKHTFRGYALMNRSGKREVIMSCVLVVPRWILQIQFVYFTENKE